MGNNFSDCSIDPEQCDLDAKKQMSELTTARVVMESLSCLGYMCIAFNTIRTNKGQKAGLLFLQVMLAMSSLFGALAFNPKTNKDALPIVVLWNITMPGKTYSFKLYFF